MSRDFQGLSLAAGISRFEPWTFRWRASRRRCIRMKGKTPAKTQCWWLGVEIGLVPFGFNNRVCEGTRAERLQGRLWTGAREGWLSMQRSPYKHPVGQGKSSEGVG